MLLGIVDREDLGWVSAAVLLFGVVSKFTFDVWTKYGADKGAFRRTTIEEYQGLLTRTEKTLADVMKDRHEREEEHGASVKRMNREHTDCLRKYDQLLVRLEWMETELRRAGVAISIWPKVSGQSPHPPDHPLSPAGADL